MWIPAELVIFKAENRAAESFDDIHGRIPLIRSSLWKFSDFKVLSAYGSEGFGIRFKRESDEENAIPAEQQRF